MVERIHRTLKVTLCARGGAAAWKDHLPLVLLGMWAAPREESGISVAEVVLQQQLVVPGQLPPPTERPAGMEELSVPPAVMPPTGRSFAKRQPHQPWMGQTGSTWQRGGPPVPWRKGTAAPTRCWRGATRCGAAGGREGRRGQ